MFRNALLLVQTLASAGQRIGADARYLKKTDKNPKKLAKKQVFGLTFAPF